MNARPVGTPSDRPAFDDHRLAAPFRFFFFWTIHPDFPPQGYGAPSIGWLALGLVALIASWALTLAARIINGRGRLASARGVLALALVLGIGGGLAFVAGPWMAALDPTTHAYPAIVWLLVV